MVLLKKQLKYNCAELAIRKLIADRGCKAGDKIPSLEELGVLLPYSEITLRHALQSLEDAGLIRRKVGLGTFLRHALQHAETGSFLLYVHLRTPYKFSSVTYPLELQDFLAARGVGLRYLDVERFTGDVAAAAENAAGIIIAGVPDQETVREFELLRLPAVTVGAYRVCGTFPDICLDASSLGYQMTRHFLRRGRRKIMFYDHGPYYINGCECRKGYEKAMAEQGMTPLVLHKDYKHDKPLLEHLGPFFTEHPDTDAVLISAGEVFQYLSYLAMHPERKTNSIGLLDNLPQGIVWRSNPDFVFCASESPAVRAGKQLLEHLALGTPLHTEFCPVALGGM